MVAKGPLHAVETVDEAFTRGDLETVLRFYEDGAVVVTEPGKWARGKVELRAFFERVMKAGSAAKQRKTYVIEAEDVALFTSRWTLVNASDNSAGETRTFVATTVLRRQPDGVWKAVIDNAFGPLVLGPE